MDVASTLTTRPLAHRGLHGHDAPENSLAAFAAACEADVGIELDVHPVADDAVAVFHDLTLERMCGVSEELAACDRAALRGLRLAGTDEHVPVLEEVLELVAGRVPLAIELKQPTSAEAGHALCTRVSRLLATYPGRTAVLSFDPRLLRWFRRHAATIPRVQLAASPRVPEVRAAARELGLPRWQVLALEHLVVNAVSRPQAVGYDIRALPHPAARRTRRRGRALIAGIVRTDAELEIAGLEADGIVFETLTPAEVRASRAFSAA